MSKRSFIYLLARGIVALASPLVPRWRRREWRETWEGELWHGGARRRARTLRRSIGALPHALSLRASGWSRNGLLRDLHYGLRSLRRQPGFTAVALLVLTLGIGANTTIFSLVNSLLIRPLGGVEEPERLVGVWRAREGRGLDNWSYPNYLDIRAGTPAFSGAVAFDTAAMTLRDGPSLERVAVQLVSRDFFAVLGAQMAQGTSLGTGAASRSAVLAYGAWQRRFGGRPMLGETIELNGVPLRVTGIAGSEFTGLDRTAAPEIFAPLDLEVPLDLRGAPMLPERGTSWLLVVARLAPETSLEQARAAAVITTQRLREMEHNAGLSVHLAPANGLDPDDAGEAGMVLGMLMGVVALLLLCACANVASLLLARSRTRTHEYGVRLALGASPGRLVRQLLIEGLVLSLAAAALGLLAARWSAGLLMAMFESLYDASFSVVLEPDLRIVGFSTAVAAFSVLIFGVAPALRAARHDSASLIAAGRTSLAYRRGLLANGLVIAQVALSVVVLIVAGLFVRSMQIAWRTDAGLDIDRLVVVTPLALAETSSEATLAAGGWRQQLAERLQGTALVESLAWSDTVPLGGTTSRRGIYTVPNDADTLREVRARAISPGYFRTMGIPLLAGREFTAADTSASDAYRAPVLIINEPFANSTWPGEPAVGKHLYFGDRAAEVVGVVAAAKYASLTESPGPVFYLPLAQTTETVPSLIVRTAGDPAALVALLRDLLAALPGRASWRR